MHLPHSLARNSNFSYSVTLKNFRFFFQNKYNIFHTRDGSDKKIIQVIQNMFINFYFTANVKG